MIYFSLAQLKCTKAITVLVYHWFWHQNLLSLFLFSVSRCICQNVRGLQQVWSIIPHSSCDHIGSSAHEILLMALQFLFWNWGRPNYNVKQQLRVTKHENVVLEMHFQFAAPSMKNPSINKRMLGGWICQLILLFTDISVHKEKHEP